MGDTAILYIRNATIYTPRKIILDGAVLIEGDRIVAVGSTDDVRCTSGARALDATGLIVTPGYIDLQINGAFGDDFTDDPASIWRVAERLPRYGVTCFLPTIISSPLEKIVASRKVVLKQQPDGFCGARPLGLHLEGPFLNPQKRGAHNPRYLCLPDASAVADWFPGSGVRMVTLAPELPGALELIRVLAGRGVLVSEGHSMASYDEARVGMDAGARYGTHLFNAMPALGHRDPGLVGALLTDSRATAGLIADGIHIHPSVIRLVWQALGSARLTLVTDAMAALGMDAGKHLLGDFEVIVDSTSARLADGALAGSILSLDQALRNLINVTGCTLAEVLATVTTTPARLLGISGDQGQIAPGFVANLVLLTPDLRVRSTIIEGILAWPAP